MDRKPLGQRPVDWAAIRVEALGDLTTSLLPADIEFPALPHAVTLYVQKARDESITMHELAEILEADSGLTIQLLKYVNSSFMAVKKKVVSVLQALSLLGSQQSLRFVIATGMQAAIRAHDSKLIDQDAFWSTNLQKAIFAREIAVLLGCDPEVAFVGSLLQDFALPVLTNDMFEDYGQFELSEETTSHALAEFEQARFGWDHGLVGACLAHGWNLPDELVCCICYHHSGLKILTDPTLGRTPVAATALSALLPDQFNPHDHGFELLMKLQAKWPAFNLHRLAESVDRQHLHLALGIPNQSPLLPRCKSLEAKSTASPVAATSVAASG
jgi:HD-like signal output (HDOD) protein